MIMLLQVVIIGAGSKRPLLKYGVTKCIFTTSGGILKRNHYKLVQ